MNNAAVDSNIERTCQQTEIDLSKMVFKYLGNLSFAQKNAALQGPATY